MFDMYLEKKVSENVKFIDTTLRIWIRIDTFCTKIYFLFLDIHQTNETHSNDDKKAFTINIFALFTKINCKIYGPGQGLWC